MSYFPFMIEISNQSCLVVGGGSIAFHKVKLLLDFQVNIKVVGTKICRNLRQLAKEKSLVEIKEKEFQDHDLSGMDFVVAATDDEKLNMYISKLCGQKKIPINVVDQKELCSFIFPAIIQDNDLLVAVSTGGQSPAAAAYVKRRIKSQIPEYYGDMVEKLGEYRDYILNHVGSQTDRKEIFNRLLEYGDSHGGEIPTEIMKQTVADLEK